MVLVHVEDGMDDLTNFQIIFIIYKSLFFIGIIFILIALNNISYNPYKLYTGNNKN